MKLHPCRAWGFGGVLSPHKHTAGKDAACGKPTFVSLLGAGKARRHATALCKRAHAALQPFGDAARRLHELVDWIVARDH